jgi:hypothetical protein
MYDIASFSKLSQRLKSSLICKTKQALFRLSPSKLIKEKELPTLMMETSVFQDVGF